MRAIKKSLVFAAVLVGVFVSAAHAQEAISVKVPFPFVVNHETLPAGQYLISTAGEGVTSVRGGAKRSGAIGFTTPAGGRNPIGSRPALVFARYENGYRLAQIWESNDSGREYPGPLHARKTARAETQTGSSQAESYVLAANWK